MRRVMAVSFAAVALVAAGCGSDDEKSDTGGGGGEKSQAKVKTVIKTGEGPEVAMKNTKFVPPVINAKVGQAITWSNDDAFDHNVTATAGEDFKSKDFGQGGKFVYTLDEAGTIKYTCTLHPGMDGTIVVAK